MGEKEDLCIHEDMESMDRRIYCKLGNNGRIEERVDGVLTVKDIIEEGRKHGICGYIYSRECARRANVLIYKSSYILDPKLSELRYWGIDPSKCLLVFEEAHILPDMCSHAFSMNINRYNLQAANTALNLIEDGLSPQNANNMNNINNINNMNNMNNIYIFQKEYAELKIGIREKDTFDILSHNSMYLSENIEDLQIVPGNIRRVSHFISMLRRVILYLQNVLNNKKKHIHTPLKILLELNHIVHVDKNAMIMAKARLASLIHTLQLNDLDG